MNNNLRNDNVGPTPTPIPTTLQDQIRAVQETRPPPRRKTGKVVGVAAVLAAIIGLWQFGPRFGWGPGGKGAGNGSGTGTMADNTAILSSGGEKPQAPQRPLRVTIDSTRYLVNGKEVDLPTITQLVSKVPAGEGPAIEIKREGSSRVKAEQDLKAALDEKHVSATWTPPLE
jgi:hypothetical protein